MMDISSDSSFGQSWKNLYPGNMMKNLSIQSEEIELASPWARMGAVLINSILFGIAILPVCFIFLPFVHLSHDEAIVKFMEGCLFSILLLSILAIWQVVWITKRGQSIGKCVMGIKVISLEEHNSGFAVTVLMREIVFCFITEVISIIIGMFLVVIQILISGNYFETSGISMIVLNMAMCFPYLICLIMLFFPKSSRRTLQDYLAQTVVIKV